MKAGGESSLQALTAMQRGSHAGLVEDARKRSGSPLEGIPAASRLHLEVTASGPGEELERVVGIEPTGVALPVSTDQ
jgi:hypothetical protein